MLLQIIFLTILAFAFAPEKVGLWAHFGGLLYGTFLGLSITEQYNTSSNRLGGYEKKVRITGFVLMVLVTGLSALYLLK